MLTIDSECVKGPSLLLFLFFQWTRFWLKSIPSVLYCQSRCESILLTKVVVSAILPSAGHMSSFPQERWLVKGLQKSWSDCPTQPCLVPPVSTLHRGPHLVLVRSTQAQWWHQDWNPAKLRQLSNVLGQPMSLSSCFYSHLLRICWFEVQRSVQSCVSMLWINYLTTQSLIFLLREIGIIRLFLLWGKAKRNCNKPGISDTPVKN